MSTRRLERMFEVWHALPHDATALGSFGLTVALAQWVTGEDVDPPVVQIDMEDGNPIRLSPYEVDQLVAALTRRATQLREG